MLFAPTAKCVVRIDRVVIVTLTVVLIIDEKEEAATTKVPLKLAHTHTHMHRNTSDPNPCNDCVLTSSRLRTRTHTPMGGRTFSSAYEFPSTQ